MNSIPSFQPKHILNDRFNQRGVAAVEFALVAAILFTLLIGIMEMGRILFYWNTATETTRLGARLAVVCNQDASAVKFKMQEMLNILDTSNISVRYTDINDEICDTDDTCRFITVSITGLTVPTVIPFVPMNITMPPFSTTLPRESMDSANPDCK